MYIEMKSLYKSVPQIHDIAVTLPLPADAESRNSVKTVQCDMKDVTVNCKSK